MTQMRFNKGTSSNSSRPLAAKLEKKEKRKEKFMKKIMSGDEATKSASFQKRLPTLKRKAWELQTLSGVTVCVVATGLDGKVRALWPEEPEKVREAIESYRNAKKKDKNEMTVLGYLDDRAKKLEKKTLRALGKKLSNWIDGLEGDDEGLRNAVGFLGSKIEELEDRIRDFGLGGAEDRKGKRAMMTSSTANVEEPKMVVTSSSDSPSDGASRRVSSADWFSGENCGCGQLASIGQIGYEGVGDFDSPPSYPNNNGGGCGGFPLTEQSIQEEVGNGVEAFQPTPLNWDSGNDGGGSNQFPSTGFFENEFGVYGDELYQGIPVDDDLRRSSIAYTQSSMYYHDYSDVFGVVGSSDFYQGISMGDESMRLSTENSLFGGYGGGEAFGLYETVPFHVWNLQH